MKIHMENEPKKGKVETTRNDRREKEKPNKTKRKANLKLVWLWLSWQGERETEGGGGREGEGRTAPRHFFHSCSLLSHFTQTNCLIPLFGN